MRSEIARKSVLFLIDQLKNSNCENRGTINFFGGEPLLSWNLITDIVDYANKEAAKVDCEIDFTLSTNGTLLDNEKIDFIRKNKITTEISIDSHDETIHNKLRPFVTGEGSFKTILENINLLKKGDPIGIKATITPLNLGISEYFKYFSRFKTFKSISFSPIFSIEGRNKFSKEDIRQYKAELHRYANFLFENWSKGEIIRPENSHLEYIRSLANGVGAELFCSCPAARSSIVISANGEIFACEPLIDVREFYLGHIESGIDNSLRNEVIIKINKKNKKGCKMCPAKFFCKESCIYCSYIMEKEHNLANKARPQILKHNFFVAKTLLERINILIGNKAICIKDTR